MTEAAPLVVITTGTDHHPFDRLVRAAQTVAEAGYRVRLQAGTSREPAPGARVRQAIAVEEMQAWLSEADFVVTHGGPGSIWLALELGHVPIVVPRDPALGEHIDGHQLQFCEHLQTAVHVLRDPGDLVSALAEHATLLRTLRPPSVGPARREAYARSVGQVVARLLA